LIRVLSRRNVVECHANAKSRISHAAQTPRPPLKAHVTVEYAKSLITRNESQIFRSRSQSALTVVVQAAAFIAMRDRAMKPRLDGQLALF